MSQASAPIEKLLPATAATKTPEQLAAERIDAALATLAGRAAAAVRALDAARLVHKPSELEPMVFSELSEAERDQVRQLEPMLRDAAEPVLGPQDAERLSEAGDRAAQAVTVDGASAIVADVLGARARQLERGEPVPDSIEQRVDAALSWLQERARAPWQSAGSVRLAIERAIEEGLGLAEAGKRAGERMGWANLPITRSADWTRLRSFVEQQLPGRDPGPPPATAVNS